MASKVKKCSILGDYAVSEMRFTLPAEINNFENLYCTVKSTQFARLILNLLTVSGKEN